MGSQAIMSCIFSGVQPTGNMHLGNYLGAVRQWVKLQAQQREAGAGAGQTLFCVVDLHAMTQQPEPQALKDAVLEVMAAFLAAGIDPKQATIFVQSDVSAHADLAWLLSCLTPMGWLNRMTQFKEKAGKHREEAVVGLYAYPVLMAADILLYQATDVPVGEDQKQHIELARDIAGAFNRAYAQEFFVLPQARISGAAPRIMSLRDGTKKMSKSDISDYSRINLTDSREQIALKIQKAKTDSLALPEDINGLQERPEARNLLSLYAAMTDQELEPVVKAHAGQSFSGFKTQLAEVLANGLGPITQEMRRLKADPGYLFALRREGAERARAMADKTMQQVRQIIGL
jgi:tryptophanyl-tRNA synthetase